MKSTQSSKQIILAAMVSTGLALWAAGLHGQQTPPDNTKANAPDAKGQLPTAGQQSNARSDVDISRQIRQAIVADKSLSTNAHNVKVITQHGKVTLRGPVGTEDEKKTIEAKASEVAGAGNVTSRMSVAHPRSTSKTKRSRT